MRRLSRGVRMLAACWLRSLWRSLVASGAVYGGVPAHQLLDPPATGRGLLPELAGPPPAHPERLRTDLPLSVQERRLDRELRATYDIERPSLGGS
ncbi:DUF6059 family protein [Streptomyces sp. NPDC052043]|uniref:DUF6059 family protein n=1 Tax=Streptomyces sp. NPDC052043 TaxID=3365684 RepID=UPI0037D2A3A7